MPLRRYYRCRANTADAVQRCSRPRLNAERIEQAVWQWVQTVLTPESIERGVVLEEQQIRAQRATLDADIAALSQRRNGLEQEQARMIQAYKAGILSLEELARDKTAYDAALKGIDAELARLDRLHRETPCFDVAALKAKAHALRLECAHLSDEERIRLLDMLEVRAVCGVNDEQRQYADVSCVIRAERLSDGGALCHTAQAAARCHSLA
jgi:hypothetical protein